MFCKIDIHVKRDSRGPNGMVDGFTTTCTCPICVYHNKSCEFDSHTWWSVLDTTLRDKIYLSLAAGRWFSLGTPVSSINETDHHNITEILLKVTLNTINLTSICDNTSILILKNISSSSVSILMLVLCQLGNFSATSWREQDNFQWDYGICFVLDQ